MLAELTDKEILRALGARLKAYRLRQNVSVEDVARRAGLSPATVVRAEAGRNPTLHTLVRILRALGRLSALDAFLPVPMVSPMELVERKARRPRKHAYPRRSAGDG